jgi:choline dehydrogenase-like flavoprotein
VAKPEFDVLVVGSGAAGGMAAHELSRAGARVLMLEAGPMLDLEKDFYHHKMVFEFPHRGLPKRERAAYCYAANAWNKASFVDERENPYTGTDFVWVRARAVGGKTLHWGLVSLRLAPNDFKGRSHDGYGVDWPVSYQEIEPYYERVERLIGISGNPDRIPNNPDSIYLPPVPLTCGEHILRRGVESYPGRRLIMGRTAIATRAHNGRPACHYCGHCDRVCDVRASFSSLGVLIPPALATGKLTIRPNSLVHTVLVDRNNRATGVAYVDRLTHRQEEARGRIVVLGASTLETTRLLLNSKSAAHPDGLGNSSGALGKYFCEHIMGGSVDGIIHELAGRHGIPSDARPHGSGAYIPKFRNVAERSKEFLRGYGFEGGAGAGEFPSIAHRLAGFGASFKREVKRMWPTTVGVTGFGEVLPRADNYVELDPARRDAWGIPVLRFHVTWGENELAMVKDMTETAEEMFRTAKIEITRVRPGPLPPGYSIHEAGTARMGNDPRASVVNRFNQSHDVRNLFLVDGSVFCNSSEKNPTLTIMALAMRASEYIVSERKKGHL